MALTPRRKRFCEFYVASLNAKEAAVEAGYSNKGKSASVSAARNMKLPEVQKYIAELQAQIARRNEISQDTLVQKLRDTYDAATAAKQYNAANRAVELEAKMGGLLKDRMHITGLQETSTADLIKELAQGDAKKEALLREIYGAEDSFDVPETRH